MAKIKIPVVRLPTDRLLTREEVRRVFEQYVLTCGSVRAAARELGITAQHLYYLLDERRSPGPQVLEAIGFEQVIGYQRKAKKP